MFSPEELKRAVELYPTTSTTTAEVVEHLGYPTCVFTQRLDGAAPTTVSDCVCSIESGPCERVESLQMSGRF